MAFSPVVKIRLSPSMLASLEFLAERDECAPATLAADIVKSYVRQRVAANHWESQAQEFYAGKLQMVLDASAGDDPRAVAAGLRATFGDVEES